MVAAPRGDTVEQAASAYLQFFACLSDGTVDDIRQLAAPGMRYADALTDRRGIDQVTGYLHSWFESMQDLRFDVHAQALDGHVLLSQWTMHFRVRRSPRRAWTVEGASRVTFSPAGEVLEHIDYWDATPLLRAVPVLGGVVTLTRRLIT